jgi:hypothetical protein
MMVFSLDFCLCRFVRGPSAVERKIRSVIEKWDQEDKEEDFIQSDTVTDTVSCKTRTTQCITPPLQQNVLTESDKRLRAFVRRFGSKYRTQMQPMTTSEVSKGGRKNFKISKQDLASIHADASRRMKNYCFLFSHLYI